MRLIRSIRRAKGLTQAKLAGRLKISKAAVCAWETGRNRISAELLPRVANVLNVDPERLDEMTKPGVEVPALVPA